MSGSEGASESGGGGDRPPRFGQRFLADEARVFEQNAWDDVPWTAERAAAAELVVASQRADAADADTAAACRANSADNWRRFYATHEAKFFKTRNWLPAELTALLGDGAATSDARLAVLEVGCGNGSSVFPLLDALAGRDAVVHCCDFAANAVQLVRADPRFDAHRCDAFVWDIADDSADIPLADGSVHVVLLIFVLSAVEPSRAAAAVQNLARLLKPGGRLLFRDYGRYDLTQLRFKPNRCLDGNLYARGDETLVYFFEADEVEQLFSTAGLVKENLFVDRRMLVNRAKRSEMYRVWIHANKQQLYRVCLHVLERRATLEAILTSDVGAELQTHAAYGGDRCLFLVLLCDALFGTRRLRCSSDLVAPIHCKRQQLQLELQSLPETAVVCSPVVRLPRYALVNTLKRQVDEVVALLADEGWHVHSAAATSRKSLREAVAAMSSASVLVDAVVPGLLAFAPATDLHDHWLVVERSLLLLDKASCLPVVCLDAPPGAHVLDACAAPGIKTIQIAARMENRGNIWCVDKDEQRLEVLAGLLQSSGVRCADIVRSDFLRLNLRHRQYSQVEYVLVDAPCSGSGMASRHNELTDDGDGPDWKRLNGLGNLQAMLLKWALSLASVRRCVYSTCSVHERENEVVVEEALAAHESRFRLANALPDWKHRGRKGYPSGRLCLRASPSKDLTNGFFVAVFERFDS